MRSPLKRMKTDSNVRDPRHLLANVLRKSSIRTSQCTTRPPTEAETAQASSLIVRAIVGPLWLLRLCGIPDHLILAVALHYIARRPSGRRELDLTALLYCSLPGEALTIWYTDPDFQLGKGPRPLALHGPHPSLESLFSRVHPSVDTATGFACLKQSRVLRKEAAGYVPRRRDVSLRGQSNEQAAHFLRALVARVATAEQNRRPRKQGRGWFDRTVLCPRFPVRDLPEFDCYFEERGGDLFEDLDSFLRLRAKEAGARAARIEVGVNMHHYRRPITAAAHFDLQDYLQLLRTLDRASAQLRPLGRRRTSRKMLRG
jgi:hypothetical protein